MIVTLELTTDEACVLQEIAQAAGATVEAVLHMLIAQVSPAGQADVGCGEADDREAPTDDEAVTEKRREQEEVEANIRRWHEERAPV